MSLLSGRHFLLAGLFLSVSALTPEECQPLLTPLSLADPQLLSGRFNFIMGYTNAEEYNSILRSTHSSWMKVTASASNASQIVMYQENKINGTCFNSTSDATIDGTTATISVANITIRFQVLPTCDGCLVFSSHSSGRDLGKYLRSMNMNTTMHDEHLTAHALYLMSREATVKDSDLETFKQQARCFGYSREPDFHYDPREAFCPQRQDTDA